jgi:hypothetical protein
MWERKMNAAGRDSRYPIFLSHIFLSTTPEHRGRSCRCRGCRAEQQANGGFRQCMYRSAHCLYQFLVHSPKSNHHVSAYSGNLLTAIPTTRIKSRPCADFNDDQTLKS